MMVMMTFVDTALTRRYSTTMLGQFPWSGIENTGQGRTEKVMMVTVVLVSLKRLFTIGL